jgi:hypothetical protein
MRIQREGAQLQIRGTRSAGYGDDQARFLADLRALRDSAVIGYDELSARAHYPSDVLKEAENGPSLPGLPILSAYVRACEGDVLDWEERWRRLNPEVPDDPDLPVRPAGASAAAVAGARAGVGVAPPDVYDPDRIRAALRGGQGRTEQPGRKADDPGILTPAAADARPGYDQAAEPDAAPGWGASPGWDAVPDPHVTSANGHDSAQQVNRGPFDAAFTTPADAGGDVQAEEDFSWLQQGPPQSSPADNEPSSWSSPADNGPSSWSSPAGNEPSSWSSPAENEPSSWSARTDSGLASLPEPGLASLPETGSAAPEPDITERIPRYQVENMTAPDRTDFWSKPASSAPASSAPSDVRPSPAARAEEHAITRASWPSTTETAVPSATETTPRVPAGTAATGAATTGAAAAGAAAGAGTAQPVSPQGSPGQPAHAGRPDRYFPVRLLVVIIIAALIGSALVLILK